MQSIHRPPPPPPNNINGLISADEVKKWKWEETPDALVAYSLLLTLFASFQFIPNLTNHPLADLPYFTCTALLTLYIGAHRGLTNRQRTSISFQQGLLAPFLASISIFSLYLILKFLPDLNLQTLLDVYFFLIGSVAVTGTLAPLLFAVGERLPGLQRRDVPLPTGWFLDDEGRPIATTPLSPLELVSLPVALLLCGLDVSLHHGNFTLNNLIASSIACDIIQLVGLRSFRVAGVLACGMLLYDVFWVFGSSRVVGESVMVSVATSASLNGPLKFLFPRFHALPTDYPFSVLGLGDIAIPALILALALRYDASRTIDMASRGLAAATAIVETGKGMDTKSMSGDQVAETLGSAAERAYERIADQEQRRHDQRYGDLDNDAAVAAAAAASSSSESESVSSPSSWVDSIKTLFRGASSNDAAQEQFDEIPDIPIEVLQKRPYFTSAMVGYGVGLLLTFGVNAVTRSGQPALLYLVPSVLGALCITATERREFGRVWSFEDRTPDYLKVVEKRKQEAKDKEAGGKV